MVVDVTSIKRDIRREPAPNFGSPLGMDSLVLTLSSAADEFPPWGVSPEYRDRKLRAFWPTEPIFAGALFNVIAKYIGLEWDLSGPSKTVHAVQNMLNSCEQGRGISAASSKMLTDMFTQDNGGWWELIRSRYDDPSAAVIGVSHLESGRVIRTGRPTEPAIYRDIYGKLHHLKWYEVVEFTDMPSPIEAARGMQYCALSRVLIAAQTLRDVATYNHEKISGRYSRAIHLVGGIQQKLIQSVLDDMNEANDNKGLVRFAQAPIIAALDPTATVSHEQIDMASLPDGFDYETLMRWYINHLALSFGADYQDFAPLPGHNLGTAQQSQIMHTKARSKGPALFTQMMMQAFNFRGILPRTVTLTYGRQDVAQDEADQQMRLQRAQERDIRIQNGEITPQIAMLLAMDAGDLRPEYGKLMGVNVNTGGVVIDNVTTNDH